MNARRPPMRQKPGIDRGFNNTYNDIYKCFLITVGIRNDDLWLWVQEARLPYTKSLVMGWRSNPDKGKSYRIMRLEELIIMTELVRRKKKELPLDDMANKVTLKGYSVSGGASAPKEGSE